MSQASFITLVVIVGIIFISGYLLSNYNTNPYVNPDALAPTTTTATQPIPEPGTSTDPTTLPPAPVQ